MKLPAYLATAALLATSASAVGPSIPLTPPKRPDGKPAPTENWKWSDPFASPQLPKFTPSCTAQRTFKADEFQLDDLSDKPPQGIFPYKDGLKKVFADRAYPGSWDGIDPHGYDRNLLVMGYSDVPLAVRDWIEEQNRLGDKGLKGLFPVFQKAVEGIKIKDTVRFEEDEGKASKEERDEVDEGRVVIFAPGALYEILPLWVAEGSDCVDELLDITKYSAKLADGGVVAYPVEKSKAKRREHRRNMEFTIKAEVLKLKAGEKLDEEAEAPKAENVEEKPASAGKEEL